MFAFYALTAVLYVLNVYDLPDNTIFGFASTAIFTGVV